MQKIIMKTVVGTMIFMALALFESAAIGGLLPTYVPPGSSTNFLQKYTSRLDTTILVFTYVDFLILFWVVNNVVPDIRWRFGKEVRVS